MDFDIEKLLLDYNLSIYEVSWEKLEFELILVNCEKVEFGEVLN